ncbi:hypothetical protein OIU77_019082 [Salix suchowensis]|uniref:Uncharacterized protein n=1 Tax=Salix suchowensis TaxID=1278906 RepID=A0ABQ9CHV4_9ROSI|nr:hypothetical protein OIU77_019082 [Salix suchowensis]
MSNLLAVYPLQSLSSEKVTSIRALQISGNLAVYCLGRFCQRQLLPCLLEKVLEYAYDLLTADNLGVCPPDMFVLYPFSFVYCSSCEYRRKNLLSLLLGIDYLCFFFHHQLSQSLTLRKKKSVRQYNNILDEAVKLFLEMYVSR